MVSRVTSFLVGTALILALAVLPGQSVPGACIAFNSTSSLGSDFWTTRMVELGLFTPHANNCDSNVEAFVELGLGGGTPLGIGYCVEKNPSTEQLFWVNARDACLARGKRLLELPEYQYACQIASGQLVGIPPVGFQNSEWISNYPGDVHTGAVAETNDLDHFRLGVYTTGKQGNLANPCADFGFINVASSLVPTEVGQLKYRCVR